MFRKLLYRKQRLFHKPLSVHIGDFLSTRKVLTIILTIILWSILILAIFTLLYLAITFIIPLLFDAKSLQNPLNNIAISVISGLIGAIIGAITGGIISLRVQTKELQASAAIDKRDTIYQPMRDELLELNSALKRAPYSSYISTLPERYLGTDVRFSFWSEMKSTSKSISIPKWVRAALDKYILTIENYNSTVNNANEEITKEIGNILHEKYKDIYPPERIVIKGSMAIAREIILHEWPKGTIINQFEPDTQNIIVEELDELEPKFYERSVDLSSVRSLISLYEQINEYTKELIKELETRILYINYTYEGHNDRF